MDGTHRILRDEAGMQVRRGRYRQTSLPSTAARKVCTCSRVRIYLGLVLDFGNTAPAVVSGYILPYFFMACGLLCFKMALF